MLGSMKKSNPSYQRHRFPSAIISHAVWLYHRFCLRFREGKELLAERGVTVTYETGRQWCQKFSPQYARKLTKRQGQLGDAWYLDKRFILIQGQQQYLWRAVNQDGDTIDLLVQPRRNKQAAIRFFRRLLKGQGGESRWLITDKPRSYNAARRTAPRCRPSSTSMDPTRTIAQKSLINRHDKKSIICAVFPHRLRLNEF